VDISLSCGFNPRGLSSGTPLGGGAGVARHKPSRIIEDELHPPHHKLAAHQHLASHLETHRWSRGTRPSPAKPALPFSIAF
jgi:hypothetical protein